MKRSIEALVALLALAAALLLGGGCAAPQPRGGEELGEIRGGSGGIPTYKNVPWSHPAWGP